MGQKQKQLQVQIDRTAVAVSSGSLSVDLDRRVHADADGETPADGPGENSDGSDAAASVEEVPAAFAHISVDEWARIQSFASTPEDERSPDLLLPADADPADRRPGSRTTNPVTAERCRRIRRDMGEATTVREVVEEYPQLNRSELFRHAYGECGHVDLDAAPTASPQIRREECRAMREAFAEGYSVSEIGADWYRAENTVTRHVFGRCSHDPDPRTFSPSAVPNEIASRLRDLAAGTSHFTDEELAAAMRLRPEVVSTILAVDSFSD